MRRPFTSKAARYNKEDTQVGWAWVWGPAGTVHRYRYYCRDNGWETFTGRTGDAHSRHEVRMPVCVEYDEMEWYVACGPYRVRVAVADAQDHVLADGACAERGDRQVVDLHGGLRYGGVQHRQFRVDRVPVVEVGPVRFSPVAPPVYHLPGCCRSELGLQVAYAQLGASQVV